MKADRWAITTTTIISYQLRVINMVYKKKTTKKAAPKKATPKKVCTEHKDEEGNWFPPLSPTCVVCGSGA